MCDQYQLAEVAFVVPNGECDRPVSTINGGSPANVEAQVTCLKNAILPR